MLEALPTGAVWAQMSTIGIEATETIASMLVGRRRTSCSSTRRYQAARSRPNQGKLTIFASGPDEAQQRVELVFAAIGDRTLWVGPVRHRLADEAGEQHAACIRGRRSGELARLSAQARTRDAARYSTPSKAGRSCHPGSWEVRRYRNRGFLPRISSALALKDVHLALTHAGPSALRSWRRSPRSGNKSSSRTRRRGRHSGHSRPGEMRTI